MAFLLAWMDWSGRSVSGFHGESLIERARARTVERGDLRAGSHWCVYAARQRDREPPALLDIIEPHGRCVLALDRAVGADDPDDRQEMSWTAIRLLDGTACAAVRLDPTRESLELTRDPLGQRPLVYASIAGGLLVASAEDVLRGHPALSSDLDDDFLAAYLACLSPAPDATAFTSMRSVAPGESLRFDRAGVRRRQLKVDPDFSWRGQRDGAIVEQFRELLRRSVQQSCRGARRVGISLSAGMDSSSVAALAATARGTGAPGLVGVCYGFEDRPETDERSMVRRLGQMLCIETRDVAVDRLHPLAAEFSRPVSPDTPVASPFREFKEAAYQQFADAGVDIVLDGHFGDHLVPQPGDLIADSAMAIRLQPLGRELWRLYRAGGARACIRKSGWRTLGARVLGRINPPVALQRLREPWRSRLQERLAAELQDYRHFPRPGQAHDALNAYAGLGSTAEQFYAQAHGMEARSPFRDLALTRWCLSAPSDLHHRAGVRKWMLREAMRGLLPDEIRLRPKGSSLGPFIDDALRDRQPELARLRRHSQAWTDRLCADVAEPSEALWIWLESYLGLWLHAIVKE